MSDSTPLLADVDGVDTEASDLKLDAEAVLAAPLAFRMPAEEGPKHAFPINARVILLLLALVLVEAIWTVFVVMLVFVSAFGILIPVAVSTVPSAVILGLLLYAGRPHHTTAKANGDKRSLRRNINQIRVLIVLGTSWLVMAILTALFVPLLCAPLFFLCLILYLAAYVTYRQAVAVHGVDPQVAVPVGASKWRLADVSEQSDGGIQI